LSRSGDAVTGVWYDPSMRRAARLPCLAALLLPALAGCGGDPVRGARPTVPEERIERPETGPIPTQPKAGPPPPELPPPVRATSQDEAAGAATSEAAGGIAEQAQAHRTLGAAADAETARRAEVDRSDARRFLDSWERERTGARAEALQAERTRWAPRREAGVEEWLGRARAAGADQPARVAAEAARQARAARSNSDRAAVRAARARAEADAVRRFARVTVQEWVPIPGTTVDLERSEALALQLELEALRAEIAAEWADEASRRANDE
jgi:hypothetical protein